MTKIFFISDLHFDHGNIIKYCHRPFSSIDQMNETIINNWNSVVDRDDMVFHLGDFCFNKSNPYNFIRRLNGEIVFIEGNHDNALIKYQVKPLVGSQIFYNGRESILLIHTPEYRILQWRNWIIHGHHHNNWMSKYPLINNRNETINVSAELLEYTPIEMHELLFKREKVNI